MQRGKAAVQHYQSVGLEVLGGIGSGMGKNIQTNKPQRKENAAPARCEFQEEMAGHIVDQLRRAYDALLHEPVPDHLSQLLDELLEAEDKS
jgi:hypothetical protein